ncbi:MAG: hypothetical protein ABIF10_06205 [Candidatus Woesearchaeota archaeon]
MLPELDKGWNRFIEVGVEIAPFGAEFREYRRLLEKSQYWSRSKIYHYQLAHLKKIVKYCYDNVPYYRKLFQKYSIAKDLKSLKDFRKIPILKKETILKKPDEFVSLEFSKFFPNKFSSSGTTGKKLWFYLDQKNWDIEKAAIWRHFNIAGYHHGEPGVMFYPFDPSVTENVIYNPYLKWHMLNIKNLSDSLLLKHVKQIKEIEPRCIWGYPSVLYRFARFLQVNGIKLEIPIILTTSEPVYNHQKEFIEKHITGRLFDWYGMSEHTVSASHCEEHEYHINEEYVYMELVKDGGLQKIVGTSLYNYSMPFLRFDSEDFGKIKRLNCRCKRKSRILEEVIGRRRDIIKTKTGEYILRHSMFIFGHESIKEFQLHQLDVGSIVLHIVPNGKINPGDLKKIRDELLTYLDFSVDLKIQIHKRLNKKGQKQLVFKSDLAEHQ